MTTPEQIEKKLEKKMSRLSGRIHQLAHEVTQCAKLVKILNNDVVLMRAMLVSNLNWRRSEKIVPTLTSFHPDGNS